MVGPARPGLLTLGEGGRPDRISAQPAAPGPGKSSPPLPGFPQSVSSAALGADLLEDAAVKVFVTTHNRLYDPGNRL